MIEKYEWLEFELRSSGIGPLEQNFGVPIKRLQEKCENYEWLGFEFRSSGPGPLERIFRVPTKRLHEKN